MLTAITTVLFSMYSYNFLSTDFLKTESKHFYLVKYHKTGGLAKKIHY